MVSNCVRLGWISIGKFCNKTQQPQFWNERDNSLWLMWLFYFQTPDLLHWQGSESGRTKVDGKDNSETIYRKTRKLCNIFAQIGIIYLIFLFYFIIYHNNTPAALWIPAVLPNLMSHVRSSVLFKFFHFLVLLIYFSILITMAKSSIS